MVPVTNIGYAPSRRVSGSAHLHLVASSAVDSHLQLRPLHHQPVWNIQLHFSLTFRHMFICFCSTDQYSCLGGGKMHVFIVFCTSLLGFLNRVGQLTAWFEVNRRSHVNTLCANKIYFGLAQFFCSRIESVITQCPAVPPNCQVVNQVCGFGICKILRAGFVSFTSMLGRESWKFIRFRYTARLIQSRGFLRKMVKTMPGWGELT